MNPGSGSADGGAPLKGYFIDSYQNQQLDVVSPGFGTSNFNGSYVLKLID